MKMQFAALALILASSVAVASDVKFVNADGSALSGLCVAAAQSDKGIVTLATELGIAPAVSTEVLCNGTPIRAFVSQLRADLDAETVYAVTGANQAPETQLCLAALNSQEEFTRLKETHFSNVAVERVIVCNGMPLQQFVRRYQDRLAALPGNATAAR
jgi:hypothetical protein